MRVKEGRMWNDGSLILEEISSAVNRFYKGDLKQFVSFNKTNH